MNSNDVYVIVNDEQQFRLYVVNKLGSIEARLDGLESRVENLEADVKGLHAEIKHVSDEQIAFSAKMDMLLWGTGIIIGAATLAVTLWSLFKPQTHTQPETPKPAGRGFRPDEQGRSRPEALPVRLHADLEGHWHLSRPLLERQSAC